MPSRLPPNSVADAVVQALSAGAQTIAEVVDMTRISTTSVGSAMQKLRQKRFVESSGKPRIGDSAHYRLIVSVEDAIGARTRAMTCTELDACWPMPVEFPPVPGTARRHTMQGGWE